MAGIEEPRLFRNAALVVPECPDEVRTGARYLMSWIPIAVEPGMIVPPGMIGPAIT